MNSLTCLIGYFILVNIIGFALMGIDKRRARKNAFRIPEATLFSVAIIGGSLGSIIGMQLFRHKTAHLSFKIGMPVILLLQILVGVLLFIAPISIDFI
ncbi:DUF1294 domain-containing protein [Butyrivibrio sp.]|jgi:uncharacterized membrane protein YsdA (DUF1294 family)|uniref:DUF1294 domain-containing protein n=1 Tax=Butyrivibrio sp. TaxID=28121 RepID=UPI0025BCC703|nr:DUF1294 domain-containing protein [Butyrivibrio sp.]MBE5838993.1 DUF1294 domain-containing protein [Butyrivibrio sp.]MBQ9306106.1 DUF1294 domain-containing protein [Butyrivibrio sp.]